MNLSFKQAIDLHQCLRYIEACQEAIYGNDNTSDNIEVGDVSVTFHFDDGETFLDSLIVSGSECKKGRIRRWLAGWELPSRLLFVSAWVFAKAIVDAIFFTSVIQING